MHAACIFFLILLIFMPMVSFAEIISIEVPHSYSGYKPAGIIRNKVGLILAGDVKNIDTSWDISLIWLSGKYSLIKHRLLSGNRSDTVTKILNADEDFFLLTNTASNNGDIKTINGILDIGINKIDYNGNIVMKIILGGKGINYAQDIDVCEDKRTLAVLGWIDTPGGDIAKIRGGWDIVLAQYTITGDRMWLKTLGSYDDDVSGAILCEEDDIHVIYNTWTKDQQWEIKYIVLNNNGDIIREKSYGGRGSDIANKIIKTQDDSFIILASSNSKDYEIGHGKSKSDIWIIKIDINGDIIWDRIYGGSENDFACDIENGEDDSYWILGLTQSNDGDITDHIGGWDICVLKIGNNGSLKLSETYGTLDDEQPVQILKMQNHLLFLASTKTSDTYAQPFLIKKEF